MRTFAWSVVVMVVLLAAGHYPVRTASVQLPFPLDQRGPGPVWEVWQVPKVPKVRPVVRKRTIDATLRCIRHFESRGRYAAVNASGRHRGAYQFDLPTWRSVGGVGDPAEASIAEQDLRAALLLRRRGLQPWPTPGEEMRMSIELFFGLIAAAVFLTGYLLGFVTCNVFRKIDRVERDVLEALEQIGINDTRGTRSGMR